MEKWTLGLMSGTSLDGIDVAALKTDGEKHLTFGPTLFIPYEESFKEDLRSILGSKEPSDVVSRVEKDLTNLHGLAVHHFLRQHNLSKEEINLIGFHGHTLLHESPKMHPVGRTWQMGDGQRLANMTGIPVVNDLRQRDIKEGGEGAPLVPIFQRALCAGLPKPVAILNIGGIANITFMGHETLLAFDMGPGNALMDDWIKEHGKGDYDPGGAYALKGKVHATLLQGWLKDAYFTMAPPKSLDRHDCVKDASSLCFEDGAATLSAFTVLSIVEGFKHLPHLPKKLYVAGGGRHNTYLMDALNRDLPCPVAPIDILGWSSDFLEAQAFAYLAVRSIKELPLTFPGTTGVVNPVTGGTLCKPS